MSKKVEVVKSARGRKPIEIKYPRGAFTIEELFALNDVANGGKVKCRLTIRQKVKDAVKDGVLSVMDPVRTKKIGAPAQRFISTAARNAAKKASEASRRKVKVAKVEKPAESVVEVKAEPVTA
ncbi:MAG: hypothetical protein EOM15_15105 [Spirochaetia bacterium]|nr:hypothetical protein [Spirochaetia bacterium]